MTLGSDGLGDWRSPAPSNGSALLDSWSCPVKHEDWPDAVKQQTTYASKETEQVRIVQHLSLFIAHRFDELDKPYGRVCNSDPARSVSDIASRKAFGKQRQVALAPTARRLFVRASMFTRRPTGSSKGHSP